MHEGRMAEAMNTASTSTAPSSASGALSQRPTCVVCLGMAGSGKTTFVQRITSHLHSVSSPPYVVNLDPAVSEVPYPANIDIRDSVNYKEVMKQYNLGPNGGIVTSLNLFSTRFDQVIGFIEKRSSEHKYVIFDTPGQIEVFTWSASGTIITETLASTFPTVVVYIMDIVRSVSPVTFMSNMLYACSILYKTKLPFIVVLNKADIVDPSFAVEWMNDWEIFQEALDQDTSYSSNLVRSMSLVLDEFYKSLKTVGVSSLLGAGVSQFFTLLDQARDEYISDYFPELQRIKQTKESAALAKAEAELERFRKDRAEGDPVPLVGSEPVSVGRAVELQLGGGDTDDSDDGPPDTESAEEKSFQNFVQQKPSN